MVYDLDDEDVTRLAAESNGASSERARCSEKLGILETGLHDLKRLNKHRAITSVQGMFFPLLYFGLPSTSPLNSLLWNLLQKKMGGYTYSCLAPIN
jgi:hypothetical protein